MASPDRIKNNQLRRLMSGRPLWAWVINTIPQDMASTTQVRRAVARLELTPSIPILAKMEVSAANTDDPSAKISHMKMIPPPMTRWSALVVVQFVQRIGPGPVVGLQNLQGNKL